MSSSFLVKETNVPDEVVTMSEKGGRKKKKVSEDARLAAKYVHYPSDV